MCHVAYGVAVSEQLYESLFDRWKLKFADFYKGGCRDLRLYFNSLIISLITLKTTAKLPWRVSLIGVSNTVNTNQMHKQQRRHERMSGELGSMLYQVRRAWHSTGRSDCTEQSNPWTHVGNTGGPLPCFLSCTDYCPRRRCNGFSSFFRRSSKQLEVQFGPRFWRS